jgi:hypothetical protein
MQRAPPQRARPPPPRSGTAGAHTGSQTQPPSPPPPPRPAFPTPQQGNERVLKDQVRQQFKANMYETDEAKILEQKEA